MLLPVVCTDSVLITVSTDKAITRQCSQRRRWQMEKEVRAIEDLNDNRHKSANVCPSNVFADLSVMDEVLGRSSTHFWQQQAQQICRDRERHQNEAKRRKSDNHIRLVRYYNIIYCFMYYVLSQILPREEQQDNHHCTDNLIGQPFQRSQ